MVIVTPTVVYCTAACPRRLNSFPRAELLRSMTRRRKVTVSLSSVRMGPWAFFHRGLEDGTLATADCYSWPSPMAQHPSSTAGVSLKVQFKGRRAPPSPLPFLLYLFYGSSQQHFSIGKGGEGSGMLYFCNFLMIYVLCQFSNNLST